MMLSRRQIPAGIAPAMATKSEEIAVKVET
jgi:hypothetical protein